MDTLLQMCIEAVVKWHNKLPARYLKSLPLTLKDRALIMMCKRGQLTDSNAALFLHKNSVELNFSDCDIGDAVVRCISQCSRLRFLNLGSSEHTRVGISSKDFEELAAACPNLTTVLLRFCVNLTDPAIVRIAQCCPNLEELDISECNQLTDHSLNALGQHSAKLTSISFSGTQVSDWGINSLTSGINGSHLKEIVMKRCPKLTDQALESIVLNCSSLTILNFNGCPQITDRSRERVSRQQGALSKLRQISWTIY